MGIEHDLDRATEPPLRVQPKLTVSAPGDPLEQEADRVAASVAPGEHVNAAAGPVPVVSPVAVPSGTAGTSTPLDARIASPSGGRQLPNGVRRDMETTFDADFSAVRLHDTQQDRADAESIGARAFTHEHHIWLGRNALADDRGLLAHELTHVIQQGSDVRRATTGRTGTRPEATVGSAPDVQGAWYNIGIPGTDYEFDPSWSGIKTAAGLAKDAAVDVGHGIGTAAEKVWDVGKVLWQIAKVIYNGAVHALVMLIETPGKALEYIKDFVAGLVAKAPGKLQEVLAEHLAPRLGGPAETTAGAEVSIQRQEEPATATELAPETRWHAVTRHLGVRLTYLKDNWWEVIKDAALEILVPGVAPYRHFPTMIKELGQAYDQLTEGNYSQSFDHVLATAREAMAIVSSFLAQVSIAAFIIGSIIGTPIVGVAALETIGLAVIAADVSIQLLSLGQSVDNLDRPRSPDHESDYGLIADSSIAIAILLALLALGAITSAAVKALLRRFPGLAAAAESARARIRVRLGRGAKVPESPMPPARSRGATASGVGKEFKVEEHAAVREPVFEKRPGTARPTSPAPPAQEPATTTPPQPAQGSTAEDIASVQDEATQGTGRGGRSPSDPEELNAPPDRRLVSDEEVKAGFGEPQKPYRPPGATPPPPADAPAGTRQPWLRRRLQQHVEAARERFEVEGYTPNQELDIRTNPSAAPRHRGSRIDAFAKDSVMNDPDLAAVITAPDRIPEPDFIDSALRTKGDDWFDATTARSWQAHLRKYFERYGRGGLLDTGRLTGHPTPTGQPNL
ncbi:MAG TPA: DUF4157 domain-containing protein [Trebonia sp.]|nr:DUF4157 domain-containing protein [Trebonia sp.]